MNEKKERRVLSIKYLNDFIFGYDVFISYSRRDGKAYALGLKQELTKQDFRCFLDEIEMPAGEQLTSSLRHALSRSEALVLVASPCSLDSTYVRLETAAFNELRPTGKLLPISIGRTLDDAPANSPVRLVLGDRLWITENPAALTVGPSPEIPSQVRDVFRFTRRNAWRLRITTAASLVLTAMTIISLLLFILAQRARLAAERQARISDIQRLSVQSGQELRQFPERSILLAVEAVKLSRGDAKIRTSAAEQALRDALHNTGGTALRGDNQVRHSKVESILISPNNRWIIALRNADTALLWDRNAKESNNGRRLSVIDEDGWITAAAFSHDSSKLILARSSGTYALDLSNLDGKKPEKVLEVVGENVNRLVLSSDNRWLAAATGSFSYLESLHLTDLQGASSNSPPLISGRFMGDKIAGVVITPNNRWLICGGEDKLVHFWDLASTNPASRPQVAAGFNDKIEAMALSANGEFLAVGGGRKVGVWDVTDRGLSQVPRILPCTTCPLLTSVAISPTAQWVGAVGPIETAIPLWHSFLSRWTEESGDHYVVRGHEIGHNGLSFSPDGRWLATAGRDKTVRLWDLEALDVQDSGMVLSGHEMEVTCLGFSPDSELLATGGEDGNVRLWQVNNDVDHGSPRRVPLVNSDGRVEKVALSSNRKLLLTKTSKDILVLDVTPETWTTTKPFRISYENYVRIMALDSKRRWLVTYGGVLNLFGGQEEVDAILWDLQSKQVPIEPIRLTGHQKMIDACVISPDDRWLATASQDHTVHLWDLNSQNPAQSSITLAGHTDEVRAVAFSPDGGSLVSGSRDGTARLWSLGPGKPRIDSRIVANHGNEAGSGITAVAISRDGKTLVTGDYDGRVKIWSLSGKSPKENSVLRGHRKSITGLAVASDGRIISASEDSTIRIWDSKTPQLAATPVIIQGTRPFEYLAMSSDERWFVSGDGEKAELWQLGIDGLIATARKIAGRNLRAEEWNQFFPERPYRKSFADLPRP